MEAINVVILSGDITVAPTARKAANGKEFIEFDIAAESKWRDPETGVIKKQVDFHRGIAWGKCCKVIKKLSKGANVTVEGQLIIRPENHITCYFTEIVAKKITVRSENDDATSKKFWRSISLKRLHRRSYKNGERVYELILETNHKTL